MTHSSIDITTTL